MAYGALLLGAKKDRDFIQHKLPLPYSLVGDKVIVGKSECAVHADGLLVHTKPFLPRLRRYFTMLFPTRQEGISRAARSPKQLSAVFCKMKM